MPPDQAVVSISGLRLVGYLLAVATSKPSVAHVQHRHAMATPWTNEPATLSVKVTRCLRQADPMRVKPDVYREVVFKYFDKSLQPNLTALPPVQPLPAPGIQMTMSANAVVRARIDEQIKEEASVVLAAMSLTVSDALRMMLTRVAREQSLPFDPMVPNATTIKAMRDARRGKTTKHKSLDSLMADLNADD